MLLELYFLIRDTLAQKQDDLRLHETEIANATKGIDFEASVETAHNGLQKNQKYDAYCKVCKCFVLVNWT